MRWAVLLIFGTIGLAAIIAGAIWGLEAYAVFRDSVQARGTVVEEAAEKSGNSSDLTYYPVVEFSTAGTGKVRVRTHAGARGAPEYEVGQAVDVLYDSHNPGNARIGSAGQLWSGPLTAGGLGLILLVLSILLFTKIGRFERGIKTIGSGKKGS